MEIIDSTCGTSVPCGNIKELKDRITFIAEDHSYSKYKCIKRAQSYNMKDKFTTYMELYKYIITEDGKFKL